MMPRCRLSLAAALSVLAAAAPARAQAQAEDDAAPAAPAPVQAVAATPGASPEAAFDAAADLHYSAMSDGTPCAARCKQTIVRKASLGGGLTLQVRHAFAEYGDVYGIVFGAGDTWWAADALDGIQASDCGMGKCVEESIHAITVARAGDLVWVTVRVRTVITRNESRSRGVHRYDIVVGCKLGAAPTCATVQAGGHFEAGGSRIVRGGVRVHDDEGERVVPVAF